MIKDTGLILAICAFSLYIIGGLSTFAGVAIVIMVGKNDLFGWGQGTGIGYLFIFVGLGLSIMGVLFMRIFRNRGPR
jgi:hypothetical protein